MTYWAENFHMTLFNLLEIKFECHYSVSVWLSVRPSIFCTFLLHALTNIAEILNLTMVSCRKVLYKNGLWKYSWRAYYAPFAVLSYIFTSTFHLEHPLVPSRFCLLVRESQIVILKRYNVVDKVKHARVTPLWINFTEWFKLFFISLCTCI